MARHGVERQYVTWFGLRSQQLALYDPDLDELVYIESSSQAQSLVSKWPQHALQSIIGQTITGQAGLWSNRSFHFFLNGNELNVKMTITTNPMAVFLENGRFEYRRFKVHNQARTRILER